MILKSFLTVKSILSSVVVLITIASGVVAADRYLAKASELYATNLRLDYKINKDVRNDTLEQIYEIEKEYGIDINKMPEIVKKRYFHLKVILNEIEKLLEQIRQTQIQKGS